MGATPVSTPAEHVVESLENERCPFCDGDALQRGVYREDTAVLCEGCETPLIRL